MDKIEKVMVGLLILVGFFFGRTILGPVCSRV